MLQVALPKSVRWALVASLGTISFASANTVVPSATSSLRTHIAGSAPSIMNGLGPAWVEAFAKEGGRVDLASPFGPPQGALDANLAAFLDGNLDFAFLTREISEADLQRYKSSHDGSEPCVIPVAGGNWKRFGYVDSVVFVVNRQNPLRRLTFRQIDAIFSRTRNHGGQPARYWGDVGLGGRWKARAIHIVGGDAWAAEESARALTVRRHVLSRGMHHGSWLLVPGSGGDHDVVARVGADPDAIGFTGLGHVSEDVRVIAVAGPGQRAMEPSARNAKSGRYPLLRTVDLIANPDAPAATLEFARFLLSAKGQSVVVRQGDFMPLPDNTRRVATHRLTCLGARPPRDER